MHPTSVKAPLWCLFLFMHPTSVKAHYGVFFIYEYIHPQPKQQKTKAFMSGLIRLQNKRLLFMNIYTPNKTKNNKNKNKKEKEK